MAQIKGARPASGKKRVGEEMKKAESMQTKQMVPYTATGNALPVLGKPGEDKLRRTNTRPFSIKSNRPDTRQKEDSQKEN